MFDLTAPQHVTFSASKYMQLSTKRGQELWHLSFQNLLRTEFWARIEALIGSLPLVTRVTGGTIWAAGALFAPHTVRLNHGAAYTPPHSLAYCSHIVSNIQDTQLYCAHSSPPIQTTPRTHTCALPELPASQPAKSVLLKRVWLKSRPLQGKWALGWGFGVTMGQMQWRSRVARRVTTHMSPSSCVTFSS